MWTEWAREFGKLFYLHVTARARLSAAAGVASFFSFLLIFIFTWTTWTTWTKGRKSIAFVVQVKRFKPGPLGPVTQEWRCTIRRRHRCNVFRSRRSTVRQCSGLTVQPLAPLNRPGVTFCRLFCDEKPNCNANPV
jgi:hypothetical protein